MSFTLAAGAAKLLLPQNLARKGVFIQVNGASNPATFKTQTAPVSATDGFTLDPARTTGGQDDSLKLHALMRPR